MSQIDDCKEYNYKPMKDPRVLGFVSIATLTMIAFFVTGKTEAFGMYLETWLLIECVIFSVI
jgi:hypothetical protein